MYCSTAKQIAEVKYEKPASCLLVKCRPVGSRVINVGNALVKKRKEKSGVATC